MSAPDIARVVGRPSRTHCEWWQVRQYVLPHQMLERATERRLAGDWRGACEAANVTIGLDLTEVTHRYGSSVAERLEDDLTHLVPDLLRWHPFGALAGCAGWPVPLAAYPGPDGAPGPVLQVWVPPLAHWSRPLVLDLIASQPGTARSHAWEHGLHLSRQLWDARHTGELREHCGGTAERSPFHHPDGTPLTASELPTGPNPHDPASHFEWVTGLLEQGRYADAWEATGISLDPATPTDSFGYTGLALTRLLPEAIRLLSDRPGDQVVLDLGRVDHAHLRLSDLRGRPHADLIEETKVAGIPLLPTACWLRSPDLDLVRAGLLTPDQLHPLVRTALFPARIPTRSMAPPPAPSPPTLTRVRCGTGWHVMGLRNGHLQAFDHPTDNSDPQAPCVQVQRAWQEHQSWLPRTLRVQRRDLIGYAEEGNTLAVLWLLDAGFDPTAPGRRGRTLLHLLSNLDHRPLLVRLLASGLDIHQQDNHGDTPLDLARKHGSPELVHALTDAATEHAIP